MVSKIKLSLTVIIALLLMGCNSTLVVHNVKVAQVTPLFKDYVGIHGYQFTYQDDQVGSYRIDLGSVYIPATSETIVNNEVAQGDSGRHHHNDHALTSYERTTMQTVSSPGHYIEGTEMVRILQRGDDVLILLDDNSNNIGASFSDLHDYLQELGYFVDYQ